MSIALGKFNRKQKKNSCKSYLPLDSYMFKIKAIAIGNVVYVKCTLNLCYRNLMLW